MNKTRLKKDVRISIRLKILLNNIENSAYEIDDILEGSSYVDDILEIIEKIKQLKVK